MALVLLSVLWGKNEEKPKATSKSVEIANEFQVLPGILNDKIFNKYELEMIKGLTGVWFNFVKVDLRSIHKLIKGMGLSGDVKF